jgi:hypothetical protein
MGTRIKLLNPHILFLNETGKVSAGNFLGHTSDIKMNEYLMRIQSFTFT